jgi:hypothetical protein
VQRLVAAGIRLLILAVLRLAVGNASTAQGSLLPLVRRFVPVLRSDGLDTVLGIFRALYILGGVCSLNNQPSHLASQAPRLFAALQPGIALS